MIVTCPSCSARYKIDDAKIRGRGARITCPRCSHRFVVFKGDGDGGDTASTGTAPPRRGVPDPSATMLGRAAPPKPATPQRAERDFGVVGVTWRVRNASGRIEPFDRLSTLQEWLRTKRALPSDSLAYDGRTWVRIDQVGDLAEYFEQVWNKALRDEIPPPPPSTPTREDEDETDAPTTLMGHGSSLADEIRRAVQSAPQTPADAPERGSIPPAIPRVTPSSVTANVVDPFAKLASESPASTSGPDRPPLLPVILLFALLVVLLILALLVAGVIELPGGGGPAETPTPASASEPAPTTVVEPGEAADPAPAGEAAAPPPGGDPAPAAAPEPAGAGAPP